MFVSFSKTVLLVGLVPRHLPLQIHGKDILKSGKNILKFDILKNTGNSLAVQWLGLWASIVGGLGPIPGQGTRNLQAVQCSQNKQTKNQKGVCCLDAYLIAVNNWDQTTRNMYIKFDYSKENIIIRRFFACQKLIIF